MYTRLLTLQNNYSFFLFGPRGSGKSTLLKKHFPPSPSTLWIDLLNPDEEAIFQTKPNELKGRLDAVPHVSHVVIDEVQKVPSLLDLVHSIIEDRGIHFALSGSSARKLKRGGANLLGGRALVKNLFPLTAREMDSDFVLEDALQFGSFPKVEEVDDPILRNSILRAYANTYVKEEIQAEQIVRNLPGFRRFLEVAAQMNGAPLNYSKIGRDIHLDHTVVRSYFEILEDTLLGFHLPAYDRSVRKQQRLASKFYFVDTGIKRALDRTLEIPLKAKTSAYGRAFEHWLILELHKLCAYREKDEKLSYLLTKDGVEVDLIIDRPGAKTLLIKIKSTTEVHEADTLSLQKIADDIPHSIPIVVSCDPNEKKLGRVRCLHWKTLIELVWEGGDALG